MFKNVYIETSGNQKAQIEWPSPYNDQNNIEEKTYKGPRNTIQKTDNWTTKNPTKIRI